MEKLTLDTNLLRDWAWCEGRSNERRHGNDSAVKAQMQQHFTKLRYLGNQNQCEFGVTTQLLTDYDGKAINQLPGYLQAMLGSYVKIATPSLSTFPWAFPIGFVSKAKLMRLLSDVFPDSQPGHLKYEGNRKDALQLYAHLVAKRDIFLTNDKAILWSKDTLRDKWAITVSDLASYVTNR